MTQQNVKNQTKLSGVEEELDDIPVQISDKRHIQFSLGAKISIAIVIFWVFIACFGSFLAPYEVGDDPADEDLAWFSSEFILGTDSAYGDVFSKVLHGAKYTLGLAFFSTVLAYMIGVTMGFAAAIGQGWTDTIISRINDAFLCLPTIMAGLVVLAALGSGIPVLIGTAGMIYATGVYRIARALALDIQAQDFVEAAHYRGEGLWWIISREIWPNAWMPLMTDFGLRFVFAILFISALSFLGLGIQPPDTDWGSMVRQNMEGGLNRGAPALFVPAIAIASITIAINLIVDDLSAQRSKDLIGSMK